MQYCASCQLILAGAERRKTDEITGSIRRSVGRHKDQGTADYTYTIMYNTTTQMLRYTAMHRFDHSAHLRLDSEDM